MIAANLSGFFFSAGVIGLALAGALHAVSERLSGSTASPALQEAEASMELYPTTGRQATAAPATPPVFFDHEADAA